MYAIFRFQFICLNCRSMYCIDIEWENAIAIATVKSVAVKNGQNQKQKQPHTEIELLWSKDIFSETNQEDVQNGSCE